MKKLDQKPQLIISAPAVDFYGDRGSEIVDEAKNLADEWIRKYRKNSH